MRLQRSRRRSISRELRLKKAFVVMSMLYVIYVVAVPHAWNSLPDSLHKLSSLNEFTSQLAVISNNVKWSNIVRDSYLLIFLTIPPSNDVTRFAYFCRWAVMKKS